MQWNLEEVENVAVLSIAGILSGPDTSRRLIAGIAWVSAHSTGPLVLDLGGLRRWTPASREAIAAADGGWARDERPVLMCLPTWADVAHAELNFPTASVHPDRASAVAAALACPSLDTVLVTDVDLRTHPRLDHSERGMDEVARA